MRGQRGKKFGAAYLVAKRMARAWLNATNAIGLREQISWPKIWRASVDYSAKRNLGKRLFKVTTNRPNLAKLPSSV